MAFGPPAVDFYSQLSGLGDTLQANAVLRQRQQLNAARQDAFSNFTALDPNSPDYGKQAMTIAQKLGSAGDQEGAVKFLTVAQSAAERARQAQRDTVTDQHWNADYGLRKAAAARADDPTPDNFVPDKTVPGGYRPIGPATPEYLASVEAAKARAKGDQPQIIGAGSSVIVPNKAAEGPLFTNKLSMDASLDDDTIKAMAVQARAGDTSVFQNLGRGAQGAENIIRLRKEMVRQNADAGVTGSEQALRNAEMMGVKAGQRTIGTKGANIEMAATEFNQILPVVQEASKGVPRTNYPDLNKVLLAAQEKTGDPNVVKFGGGVNTLINLYARAISPSGVPTVSDKDHAREILSRAWSSGQFDAAVGMMQQEIAAGLKSPEMVRDEMRSRFLRGQGAAPVGYPAPNDPQFPPPPKMGELRGGYRFKGGSPADPASWIKVSE